MTFEQAIELQRPQTEDIKRILCCRVKGSDATCGCNLLLFVVQP
jgi:hypothetical protein